MRKTQKKFFGLLGLSAVAVMTVIAANTPGSGATAISTITDTIEVRVVGNTPAATIESVVDGRSVTSPIIPISIKYENASKLFLRQFYVDENINVGTKEYDGLDYNAGQIDNIELTVNKYGEYKFSVEAIGYDGVPSPEDYIIFKYLPVTASYEVDSITGDYSVKIDSASSEVNSVEFYINNTLVTTQNRGQFENGENVPLDFGGKGTYHIMIVAKNARGETLYIPLVITIDYDPGTVPNAGSPDTGGLFRNLNISSEDYLTTGLIIFFVLGVIAVGIILSGRKSDSKKRR